MSSLRLALKQSLEDVNPPPRKNKLAKKSGRPRGRPPKRKPGDGPRKRGRPRKHPLPEEEEDEDASSSEAEFSVSQEDESDSEHELHKEEHESSASEDDDEEERMRKRRKMQKKAMKRQQHSAAHKIQNHWKKKRKPSTDETEEGHDDEAPTAAAETKKKSHGDEEEDQEKPKELTKKTGKAKTVPPPDHDLVAYMRGLSVKKQKRNMAAGLRVKVSLFLLLLSMYCYRRVFSNVLIIMTRLLHYTGSVCDQSTKAGWQSCDETKVVRGLGHEGFHGRFQDSYQV